MALYYHSTMLLEKLSMYDILIPGALEKMV